MDGLVISKKIYTEKISEFAAAASRDSLHYVVLQSQFVDVFFGLSFTDLMRFLYAQFNQCLG